MYWRQTSENGTGRFIVCAVRSFERIRGENAYLSHKCTLEECEAYFPTQEMQQRCYKVREVKLQGRCYAPLEVAIIRVLYSFSSLDFCNLKLEGIIYLVHPVQFSLPT